MRGAYVPHFVRLHNGVFLMDYMLAIVPSIAEGLQITLKIFVITIVLSLPLGIFMAMARLAPFVPLRKFMAAYIYLMRGTPLMLQILFIYYGLPFLVSGLRLPDFRQPSSPLSLTTPHTLRKFSAAVFSPSTGGSMKVPRSWA